MGYPAFYQNVAKNGLSYLSLLFDYGDFLYPDEEGVNNCCLGAANILGNFFDDYEREQPKLLEMANGIVNAMRERRSDIPSESQEALTLRATCDFLWMIRDFARQGHPENDPHALEFGVSHLTELKQTLSPIEPEGREELEQHIDLAIRELQNRHQSLATNRPTTPDIPPVPIAHEGSNDGPQIVRRAQMLIRCSWAACAAGVALYIVILAVDFSAKRGRRDTPPLGIVVIMVPFYLALFGYGFWGWYWGIIAGWRWLHNDLVPRWRNYWAPRQTSLERAAFVGGTAYAAYLTPLPVLIALLCCCWYFPFVATYAYGFFGGAYEYIKCRKIAAGNI